ncbi:MAG: DUF2202 domain-containing protein [Velocimicrobium sp.]
MNKRVIRIVGSLFTCGILAMGLTRGETAYADNVANGSTAALADSSYTLEEMLNYAMEDEYLAQAEYQAIMDEFGVQKPFSNIIKAEGTHIRLLTPLLETYGVTVSKKDWSLLVTTPKSLEDSYDIGVIAEEKNIEMYESFLKENIPNDVKDVFERLVNASKKHLAAFQNAQDGFTNSGNGKQLQRNTNKMGRGQGQNQNQSQRNGSCILA